MHYQVTAVRLDSNTIFADVHSNGYDMVMRYDVAEYTEWMSGKGYTYIGAQYWAYVENINDKACRLDLHEYISQSPYLLSSLRDAIRLKEIEAIIYNIDECTCQDGTFNSFIYMDKSSADHLHSLITQYGDGRVETELLKVKI